MTHRFKAMAAKISRRRDLDLMMVRRRLRAIGGAYAEVSGLFPAHDEPGRPNGRLLALIADLAMACRGQELRSLRARGAPEIVHTWPGEHYRLLAALVRLTKPQVVVEIGTLTGVSALAMLDELPPGARLTTFDLIRWREIPGTLLTERDFESGRLAQEVADLGDLATATAYQSLLKDADIVFADASKDGEFEARLLANLEEIGLKQGALVVFDDIRLWNMLAVWRRIDRPKLDLTSLGHYSGTGVIDWTGDSGLD
jgi:predicted O-methyltransferase YrrM